MVCYPPREGGKTPITDPRICLVCSLSDQPSNEVSFAFSTLYFFFSFIFRFFLFLFSSLLPLLPNTKKVQILFAMQDGGARKGASLLTRYFLNGSFFSFSFFFRRYFERYSHFLSVCEYESGSWECLDRNKMKKKRNNTGLLGKIQWNTIWEINKFSADILK